MSTSLTPGSPDRDRSSRPARSPVQRLVDPLARFFALEAASGILLLVCAVVAVAWANSPWQGSYEAVWGRRLGLDVGTVSFHRDLRFWINDGLMALFFFVVGLEIRREIHDGELSDGRRAALPVFAALGGMLAPALIYTVWNAGTPGARGWGIPMATDIAFAVGVFTLLGKRVRPAVRILLLALAVIDDLGAILVIAIFYTAGFGVAGLLVAAAGFLLIFGLQRARVRAPLLYVAPALVVWAGTYASGVHPTLAGVILGLITPLQALPGRESVAPAERLQRALHGWVAFVIVPLFALANAGVAIAAIDLDENARRVLWGVSVGLVVGKPVGIAALCWLAVRLRLAALPTGMRGRDVWAVGIVAGIGFTMSIFITSLAFSPGALAESAKLGILGASIVSGVAALLAGRFLLSPVVPESPPRPPPAAVS